MAQISEGGVDREARGPLPKDQRLKVQLDQEQVAFVDELAIRDRCSRSAVISRLVVERMRKSERNKV